MFSARPKSRRHQPIIIGFKVSPSIKRIRPKISTASIHLPRKAGKEKRSAIVPDEYAYRVLAKASVMPKPMSRQTIIILRAPKWPPVSPRRSVRCFHHQLQHSEGVYVSSTSETRTDRAFGFSTGDEVASSRSQFQEIYISQSKVARQESQQQEQQREHRQQQEAEVSCSSDSSGKEPRDYKPPDERVIKLGQSTSRSCLRPQRNFTDRLLLQRYVVSPRSSQIS